MQSTNGWRRRLFNPIARSIIYSGQGTSGMCSKGATASCFCTFRVCQEKSVIWCNYYTLPDSGMEDGVCDVQGEYVGNRKVKDWNPKVSLWIYGSDMTNSQLCKLRCFK